MFDYAWVEFINTAAAVMVMLDNNILFTFLMYNTWQQETIPGGL